jgi:nicotinate-nucleotide adenylyltransferase
MNIALFGGSFNPPTIGHQLVIRQTLELVNSLDMIWLLPDYQHSFAKNETLAPAADRLAMTRVLTGMRVKLETCCIDRQMSGNTIEHLRYLQQEHPKQKFFFLMGSDNLAGFTRWPEWRTLLHLLPFYIYPRAGYPMEPIYQNMVTLTHPQQVITNISSTLVRERIAQHLPWEYLVPPPVADYIKQKRLFSAGAYKPDKASTAV